MKNLIDKTALQKAFITSIPTLTGYIIMGIAFGLLLSDIGYNFIWAGLMGLFIYGGTMQFVAVDLLANQVTLLSAALITFLIHSRHIFYSISMIDKYKDYGIYRPYLFFALTDETYALVNLPIDSEIDKVKYDLYLSILNQIYWITGDIIGALIGSFSLFNTEGVDFTMTALFIVIFLEQLQTKSNIFPAVIGLSVSCLCLVIFGPENFLLPTMVSIVITLLIFRKRIEKNL